MKARIIKECDSFYYGEIYNDKFEMWEQVTFPCCTRWGAKLELKRWKKNGESRTIEEFEL